MARLLCLCVRPPHPPTDGGRLRVFNTARLLAERNTVDLLVVEGGEIPPMLTETFSNVVSFSHDRTEYWHNAVSGAVGLGPIRPSYYFFDDVDAWLDGAVDRYDALFCSYVNVAEYARGRPVPKIIDFVDCLSQNYLTRATGTRWFDLRRLVYRWEGRALSRYERTVLAEFDHAFATTPRDAESITGDTGTEVAVLPNGVDERFLTAAPSTEREWIVFLGRMDYHPNVDAAHYFATQVFPEVRAKRPDAEFVVVGDSPTERIRDLERLEGVRVTGFVERPEEYLGQATVVVAPMRFGTGIQNKVLEGMAVGKPVVTTPLGADGIQAMPGTHLLVAETAEELASTVLDLFENRERRHRIGAAARERIRNHYTWEAVGERLHDGVLAALD
jgi:sugar transferase (PEP-CTERM/EpsH1 system associated)